MPPTCATDHEGQTQSASIPRSRCRSAIGHLRRAGNRKLAHCRRLRLQGLKGQVLPGSAPSISKARSKAAAVRGRRRTLRPMRKGCRPFVGTAGAAQAAGLALPNCGLFCAAHGSAARRRSCGNRIEHPDAGHRLLRRLKDRLYLCSRRLPKMHRTTRRQIKRLDPPPGHRASRNVCPRSVRRIAPEARCGSPWARSRR